MNPDTTVLTDLMVVKIPFGKYKGRLLCDLPVSYLEWFQRNGFPAGRLGMLLQTAFHIKTNGLEYLLKKIKEDKFTDKH